MINAAGPEAVAEGRVRVRYDPSAAGTRRQHAHTSAYRHAKLAGGVREVFYRTSDAISGHMQSLCDAGRVVGDTVRAFLGTVSRKQLRARNELHANPQTA